ncbi:development-specific 25 kDa protein-like [Teleopsis dalmanni]|uniref:development-specific 25 kDa protein-like n=1 Tax=Teleopsis dalmanni TaxID=139649 RepID=UPI0018CCBD59|nr:development-specific 25 kDa protein-like [Teleopsis dalmanni]XP_037940586.1 development-specific 25 kDa protein-like [Teleopsis dalmanni]
MLDLSGKNVVYVGGFSGVGYQVCRILMQKKISHLFVCSRMENMELLKVLQDIAPTVNVVFVGVNILNRVSIEKAVAQIVGVVKHIDVLINGVGALADKDVETTIGLNLAGLINTTFACLPYMDKTQMGHGGVVVNIASVFGLEPATPFAVYAAAKHGVVGFTRSMGESHYYQKTGVCFVCVCPGLTSTEWMVNLRENVTWEHHSDEWLNLVSDSKHQTPEECANGVVKAVEVMKNGGVYICQSGQIKEVQPTTYWHMQ